MFRYNGATWVEEKILTASDAAAGDLFGRAVAVFDDLVVVGASGKDDERGGAYIYRNTEGTTWVEERILSASDGMATTDDGTLNGEVRGDAFGDAVAVSESLAIIGAYQVNGQQGAAYIYRNTEGTTWEETRISRQNPTPPVGAAGSFGSSVAISGEVALVGAPPAESNKGTGHLFRFNGSEWVETVLVPSNRGDFTDPSTKFWFGNSVALSGDYAILGAAFDNSFRDNGAAFLFNLAPEITWNTPAAITYGTALSSTQLNASAGSVPGTFSYSPASGAAHDLLVWFEFDDAGTPLVALDSVSGEQIGAINGPSYVEGHNGAASDRALQFVPEGGAVHIADATFMNMAGAADSFSISFWQKNNGIPSSSAFWFNSPSSNGGTRGLQAHLPWSDGNIYFDTANCCDGTSNHRLVGNPSGVAGNGGFAWGSGNWHHYVLVKNGVEKKIYIDGEEIFQSSDASPLPEDFTDGYIGGQDSGNRNPSAVIDDFAIFASELEESQISLLANRAAKPGDFAVGGMLAAGTHTLTAFFTPTDTVRYTSTSKTVSITVNKATPTIAWNNPADITYGTPLGSTQLNATSSAPGTITYVPAAGTVLDAGNGQSLTASLPASANYNSAAQTVSINVNPAALTITADNKQRGAGLENPTLTATYSGFVNGDTLVAAAPTLSTSAGVSSPAGTYPILITGGSDPNYAITRQGGTLTVSTKELPVLTWANPAAVTYGTALGAAQLNATSSVAGSFTYSPASGTVLNAGSQTLMVTFTPTDTARYANSTESVSITVNQASLTIKANNITREPGIRNPPLTASYSGFVNGDTEAVLDSPASLNTPANIRSTIGEYPITVEGAADINYAITFINGALTVQSTPVVAAMDDSFRVPLYIPSTEGYTSGSDGSHFLPVLQNDQFEQPEESIDGYTLRISEVASVSEIAGAGQSLAILAFVGENNVHVRIFDSSGAMAVDKTEAELIGGSHLTELKERLDSPAELDREPRDHIVVSAKRQEEIVGSLAYIGRFGEFSTGVYFDSPSGPVDFKETDDGKFWSVGGGIRYAPRDGFTGELSVNYRWSDKLTEKQAFTNVEVVDPETIAEWGRFGSEIDGYGAYGRANAFAGVRWKPGAGISIGVDYGNAHWNEIYTAIGNDDSLGGGLPVRTGLRFEFNHENEDDPDILALESNGQLLQTFALLRPGLAALTTGEGDTVIFTQEMSDSVATLRNMVANIASPALQTAVSVVSKNVKAEDYVGKTFNGVVENLGIDPKELVIPLTRLTRNFPGFSISTVELEGIIYSLWKSTSLAVEGWTRVDHVEQSHGDGSITLTDPDSPEAKSFYRVETGREEQQ